MPVDKALQGNVSSEELKQASQTEGKYLKFRNRLKPIAFASKSLSEAEQRYSNIEWGASWSGVGYPTLQPLHLCKQNKYHL